MIVQSPFHADPLHALSWAVEMGLIPQGAGILVALSGGADSMALAQALAVEGASLGLGKVVAGHVDHGLRPESGAEAEQVVAWANALGLPAQVERVSVAGDGGLQAAARRARYQALETMRQAAGAAVIATAHTADDQAETVLLRLIRGTSPSGLAAIHPRRGRVVRPLLGCRHDALEAWCRGHGVPWLEDPSNRNARFDRVRVRREVLPLLTARLNPRITEALCRLSSLAHEDEAFLSGAAEDLARGVTDAWGGLDCGRLVEAPPALARRVLASRLRALGARVEQGAVEDLWAACRAAPGGRRGLTLPGGVTGERSLGRLYLWVGAPPRVQPGPVPGPGRHRLDFGGTLVVTALDAGEDGPGLPTQPGLRVRAAAAGDRWRDRALSEAWRRRGVPTPVRSRLPVVVGPSGQVLWAAGLGFDPEATRRGVARWALHFEPPGDGPAPWTPGAG